MQKEPQLWVVGVVLRLEAVLCIRLCNEAGTWNQVNQTKERPQFSLGTTRIWEHQSVRTTEQLNTSAARCTTTLHLSSIY